MCHLNQRKTGGLVIWRSGTAVALYRGVSYELSLDQFPSKRSGTVNNIPNKSRATLEMRKNVQDPHMQKPHKKFDSDVKDKHESAPATEVKYDTEIDKLLSTLGPRYTDWPGDGPLPVDADMLPGVVPGYKPPFRLLPYGVKSTPGNREMTALRRLARFLPPHFAVGICTFLFDKIWHSLLLEVCHASVIQPVILYLVLAYIAFMNIYVLSIFCAINRCCIVSRCVEQSELLSHFF